MQDHLGLVFLSFPRIQLPNRMVAFELIAFVFQKSLAACVSIHVINEIPQEAKQN